MCSSLCPLKSTDWCCTYTPAVFFISFGMKFGPFSGWRVKQRNFCSLVWFNVDTFHESCNWKLIYAVQCKINFTLYCSRLLLLAPLLWKCVLTHSLNTQDEAGYFLPSAHVRWAHLIWIMQTEWSLTKSVARTLSQCFGFIGLPQVCNVIC